jgi:uracil-DNA glycosylase family 4
MAGLKDLSLDELYAKEKKSKAVEIQIMAKSDFDKINLRWCDNICKLKCKNPEGVKLIRQEVDILIIQDHMAPPGKYDKWEGQQEGIQSGVINFLAKEAGFHGLKYQVTSLLKCSATHDDFPNGKPPTQTTMQKCSPYLQAEIDRVKPKVIISLATAVTKTLGLSKASNTGDRGTIQFTEDGIPVVISLHPRILTFIRQNARGSAGMWGPDYLKVIQRDFEKAKDLATGKLKYTKNTLVEAIELIKAKYLRVAKSIDDVKAFMAEIWALPETQIVSWDTETTSLDPLDPYLKLLTTQYGWRNAVGDLQTVVIPLWHRDNNAYDPAEAWEIVKPYMLSERPKVGHNIKYDVLATYWSTGIRVKGIQFDTLLLIHSIYSGQQGCYGLKVATWDYLTEMGIGGYEDMLGKLSDLAKKMNKERAQIQLEQAAMEAALEGVEEEQGDENEFR